MRSHQVAFRTWFLDQQVDRTQVCTGTTSRTKDQFSRDLLLAQQAALEQQQQQRVAKRSREQALLLPLLHVIIIRRTLGEDTQQRAEAFF
jgi:hypothetical protein